MLDLPDFDTLAKMAKENPEALERLRREQVDALISNASPENQRRLRGLQFQIDAQRRIHGDSAMGSCVKISQMMHASFGELREWLNKLSGTTNPVPLPVVDIQEDAAEAKVLRFPSTV